MQHSQSPLGHNHKFINWEFETEAEWLAFNGITAADFHKVAYVKELQKYYAPIAIDSGTGTVTWITTGGGASGTTNLGYTPAAGQGTVTSDTGTDAVIPAATSTFAGLLLPEEKDKLTGIQTGAEVNVNPDWNAVSGDGQILNKPVLGSAASQDSSAFATAAQGAKADTAVQPATLNTRLGTTGNLGTLAQQNANAVSISGGSVAGLTSVEVAGDVTFTGTGRRIRGDFSSSPISNRVSYQTTVVNGATNLSLLPNGTGTIAQVVAFGSSDSNNSSYVGLTITASTARIQSGQSGSGVYLPLELWTNGISQAVLTTAGNVGFGVSNPTSHKVEISGRAYASGGFVFPAFTVATVPSAAANTNAGIIVTNAAAGRRPYWSNGTDWRDAANVILS